MTKRGMTKSSSKKIAVLAVFIALTAAFYPIPFCFLIPVILASIWFDFLTAFTVSVAMGVISYLFSFLGGSPLSIAFVQFPLIAILPRACIGPAVNLTYRGMRRVASGAQSTFRRILLPASVAAGVGALVNTGLVVGCFALFGGETLLGDVAMGAMLIVWAISGAIEFVVDILAVPIADATCRKVLMQTSLKTGR